MSHDAAAAAAAADTSIDKVVQLLVGPNSQDLAVRHTHAISRLCRHSKDGFHIGDLAKLCVIMEVTVSAIKQGQESFEEPMRLILQCVPFKLSQHHASASAIQWATAERMAQSRCPWRFKYAQSVRPVPSTAASMLPLLCRTLSKPLRKRMSTDELNMAHSIHSMLQHTVSCLDSAMPTDLQLCACEVR